MTKQNNRSQFDARQTPVQENMKWIKAAWRVERIGYVLLGLFLLYALLGGLSQGWLSQREFNHEASALQIHYDRYLRNGTESPVVIRYLPQDEKNDRLLLQGKFVEEYDIISVSPESARIQRGHHQLMIYAKNPPLKQPATVRLLVKPRTFGNYTLSIAFNEHPPAVIKQRVFP